MKYLYILGGIFLLISCGNNLKPEKEINLSNNSISKVISSQKNIAPELEEGIKMLLESKDYEDFSDIPISESCLILSTQIDPQSANIYFSDSTINITYFICSDSNKEDYEFECYKGILNVDGYKVAILDFGNFADKYSNTDSLYQIPLNSFKCYPMPYIVTYTYYIENGKLKYWCP